MVKIYGMHTPHFLKAVYAAEEFGITYEIVPVDLMKGESKTPEHMARHPFGKIPVIEHDGHFIFESNAIVRYLGSLSQSKAFPTNLLERAKADQWLEYFAHQTGRWTTSYWFESVIGPKYFNETANEKRLAEYREWILGSMPVIDQLLAKNTYLTGNEFTMADLVAHCGMMGFKEAGLPLGDFRNFTRWFEAVEGRPSYLRAKENCQF